MINEENIYRLIIEKSGDNITIYDLNLKCTYTSPSIERILGYTQQEFMELNFEDLFTPDSLIQIKLIMEEEMLLEHTGSGDPLRIRTIQSKEYHKNGSLIWIEDTLSFLRNDDGIATGILCLSRDISERKRMEDIIQKQITEKEILLREIHHRVKNNIGNIIGMLNLKTDSTNNPEAKTVLQEAVSRMRTMHILYEKLLLSDNYENISIKSYSENIIDSLVTAYYFGEKTITINKQIDDFIITAKKAVSIGILINEILTNVFKYAFKDRVRGEVYICIRTSDNIGTLIIKDNGVGIDDKNKTTGFGLTIISMIVDQLNGTYSIVNENGAKSTIKFEI